MGQLQTTSIPGPPSVDLPPECGHQDWELGCPRCFYEAVRVARENIRTDEIDGHMAGAILLTWHMMIILADMEDQLKPQTMGIDLSRNDIARQLIANLHQLSVYMMQLGADPAKMEAALRQGALLAAQTKAAIDAKQSATAAALVSSTSGIVLTDR